MGQLWRAGPSLSHVMAAGQPGRKRFCLTGRGPAWSINFPEDGRGPAQHMQY